MKQLNQESDNLLNASRSGFAHNRSYLNDQIYNNIGSSSLHRGLTGPMGFNGQPN